MPGVHPSVLFGLGLALLSQTRPYEGLLLAIPACLYLAAWLILPERRGWAEAEKVGRTPTSAPDPQVRPPARNQEAGAGAGLRTTGSAPQLGDHGPGWPPPRKGNTRVPLRDRLLGVALPLALTVICAGALAAWYNHRVTGNWTTLPYMLYREQYGVPQTFYGQAPVPPTPVLDRYPDLLANYRWQRLAHDRVVTVQDWIEQTGSKLQSFWAFFIQPVFTLPLLFLPWILRRRRLRLLVVTGTLALAGMTLYPILYPHYAAPITGITLAVIVTGMRYLYTFSWRGRRWGRPLAGVLAASLALLILVPDGAQLAPPASIAGQTVRSRAESMLQQKPGPHLVFVRYAPDHVFHRGWVYNNADIDNAPVVWARDFDAARNRRVVEYFRGRRVWLFEPDRSPPRLSPYTAQPATQP